MTRATTVLDGVLPPTWHDGMDTSTDNSGNFQTPSFSLLQRRSGKAKNRAKTAPCRGSCPVALASRGEKDGSLYFDQNGLRSQRYHSGDPSASHDRSSPSGGEKLRWEPALNSWVEMNQVRCSFGV